MCVSGRTLTTPHVAGAAAVMHVLKLSPRLPVPGCPAPASCCCTVQQSGDRYALGVGQAGWLAELQQQAGCSQLGCNSPNSARHTAAGCLNWLNSWTGSRTAAPKITTVALVTARPAHDTAHAPFVRQRLGRRSATRACRCAVRMRLSAACTWSQACRSEIALCCVCQLHPYPQPPPPMAGHTLHGIPLPSRQ